MKKTLLLISASFSLFYSPSVNAEDISPAMKINAEEAIASCEKTYQNVKVQGQRIDNIKKPSLFGSKASKNAYKEKEKYKKVFNLRFAEFTKFSNEKIKIRTAKNPSELRDLVAAYSSNCARFAGGLVEFVEWAVTEKSTDKISETIFKDWMKDVK
jgi:hypothetical protein